MLEPRAISAGNYYDGAHWWVSGGAGSSNLNTTIYDFVSKAWLHGPPDPLYRNGHRLLRTGDGRFIITPSWSQSRSSNKCYISNGANVGPVGSITWSALPNMPNYHYDAISGIYTNPVSGVKFLAVISGGSNKKVNVMNLDTQQWTSFSDLPQKFKLAATLQYRNSFITVGGFEEGGAGAQNSVKWFNPWTKKFDKMVNLDYPTYNGAAFFVPTSFISCD